MCGKARTEREIGIEREREREREREGGEISDIYDLEFFLVD